MLITSCFHHSHDMITADQTLRELVEANSAEQKKNHTSFLLLSNHFHALEGGWVETSTFNLGNLLPTNFRSSDCDVVPRGFFSIKDLCSFNSSTVGVNSEMPVLFCIVINEISKKKKKKIKTKK